MTTLLQARRQLALDPEHALDTDIYFSLTGAIGPLPDNMLLLTPAIYGRLRLLLLTLHHIRPIWQANRSTSRQAGVVITLMAGQLSPNPSLDRLIEEAEELFEAPGAVTDLLNDAATCANMSIYTAYRGWIVVFGESDGNYPAETYAGVATKYAARASALQQQSQDMPYSEESFWRWWLRTVAALLKQFSGADGAP